MNYFWKQVKSVSTSATSAITSVTSAITKRIKDDFIKAPLKAIADRDWKMGLSMICHSAAAYYIPTIKCLPTFFIGTCRLPIYESMKVCIHLVPTAYFLLVETVACEIKLHGKAKALRTLCATLAAEAASAVGLWMVKPSAALLRTVKHLVFHHASILAVKALRADKQKKSK